MYTKFHQKRRGSTAMGTASVKITGNSDQRGREREIEDPIEINL